MAPVDWGKAGEAEKASAMAANPPMAKSLARDERFDISISLRLRRIFSEEILFWIRLDPLGDGGEDLSTGIQESSETDAGCCVLTPGFFHSTVSFVISV